MSKEAIISWIGVTLTVLLILVAIYFGGKSYKNRKLEYIQSCQQIMEHTLEQCEWKWEWDNKR